jgi:hypothetical protein
MSNRFAPSSASAQTAPFPDTTAVLQQNRFKSTTAFEAIVSQNQKIMYLKSREKSCRNL